MTTYHYTSEAGALGILEAGKIKSNYLDRGGPGHGPGVYTTTAKPSAGARVIDHNCYDGNARGTDQVEYYFKFRAPKSDFDAQPSYNSAGNHLVYRGDLSLHGSAAKSIGCTDGSVEFKR